MRLHPILLASLVGTPFISISYSPKVEIFMKKLGMQNYIVPIDKLENKKVISLINMLINNNINSKLLLSVNSLKTKAELNKKIIYKFLKMSLQDYGKSSMRVFIGMIAAFLVMCFNYFISFLQKIINVLKIRRNKK